MSPSPLWLQSQEMQQLLGRLVDRLDSAEQRGSMGARAVPITESLWPGLFNCTHESRKEELWEQVLEMAGWGWLAVKPAKALSRAGYSLLPKVSVVDVAAVRAAVGRHERRKSSAERWREAVEAHLEAPEAVRAAACAYRIDLPGRDMADVVRQLNGLRRLAGQPLLLREASAHLFWGMSKVLDGRQGLVATLLGLDECPFEESPVQMQVRLPTVPSCGTLFIENQSTFEQACRPSASSLAFASLTLVFASGFRSSAGRLRTPNGASIYYSHRGELSEEARKNFECWLSGDHEERPVHFWGDLDWSGMRILAAMRSPFRSISAWRPGYEPMRLRLERGEGHSPEEADKQGQLPVTATGCAYADGLLLPLLRQHERFVDQEAPDLSANTLSLYTVSHGDSTITPLREDQF